MSTLPRAIHFQCEEHGLVLGDRCVQCDALSYLRRVRLGLAVKKKLQEGEGPEPDHPSALVIKFRAFLARRSSEREVGRHRNGSRYWRRRQRIVRVFPDDLIR